MNDFTKADQDIVPNTVVQFGKPGEEARKDRPSAPLVNLQAEGEKLGDPLKTGFTPESRKVADIMYRDNVLFTGKTPEMLVQKTGERMGRESSIIYLNHLYGELDRIYLDDKGKPAMEKVSAGDAFWKFKDQRRRVVRRVLMEPVDPAVGTRDGLVHDVLNLWDTLKGTMPPPSAVDDPLNARSVDFFLTLLAHVCGFTEATEAVIDHSRHPDGNALTDYATTFHDILGDGSNTDSRLQVARLLLFCLHRQRFEPWKGHPQFFVVLAGKEQGTGKGVLQYTIHGVFGELACVLSATKVGSEFSDPAGLHKLVGIYEEMAPKGRFNDKESQTVIHKLRERTTGKHRKFELKGKDTTDVPNILLEIFSTNTEAALQVDSYERRMLAVGPAPLPVRFDADDPETKPNIRKLIKGGFFRDYAAHFGMRRKADPAQGPGLADLVAYLRDLPELLQTVWGDLEDMDAPRTEKANAMSLAARSTHAAEVAYLIEESAQPFDKDFGKPRDILAQLATLYPHIRSLPTASQSLATALESLGAVQVRNSKHRLWVWRNLDKWVAYSSTGTPVPTPALVAEGKAATTKAD